MQKPDAPLLPTPDASGEGYSWVYKELVESESDIVGAIAYSIYKARKIEYIREFESDNGRNPSDSELREFRRTANLPGQLDDYRDKAERYLDQFCEAVLAERVRVAEQELLKSTFVREIRPKWWRGIVDNVIAALITSLIALAALIGLWIQAVGTDRIKSDITQHYIAPQTGPAAKP